MRGGRVRYALQGKVTEDGGAPEDRERVGWHWRKERQGAVAWTEGRAADVGVEKRWWFVGHNKPDETGAEAAAKLAAGINGRDHPMGQVGGARALRRCNGRRMAMRIQ